MPYTLAAGGVLDNHPSPVLTIKCRAVRDYLIHTMRSMLGPIGFARRLFDPDPEITRNFTNRLLAEMVQVKYKFRHFAVLFIIDNVIKTKSLSHCTLCLLNADLPDRTVGNVIRNTGTLTTVAVFVPALGQIQVAGNDTAERVFCIVVRIKQMLTYDAIIFLACFAAPLTLYAGCVFSLLCMG